MKKLILLLLITLFSFQANAQELYNRLMSLANVRSVEQVDKGFFNERYIVMFEQPVDHKNPSRGKFEQRVIIGHSDFNRPNVMITEGYMINYALPAKFRHELSNHFNANQIVVEHRFFGESVPSPRDWKYMTGENAAADLHNIRLALDSIYTNKWIATGISKGGQNSMIYRTFYPNDIDVTVDYVGPICFGVEDGRHEPFLEKVSTKESRDAIIEFQREVLKRRTALMPMFEEYIKGKDLKFTLPLNEIYDYSVLEYAFSLWQWGTPVSVIPSADASHDEIFDHFINVAAPDYFAISDEPSFFVQAAAELGYYGYDTKPFADLLTIKSAKNYMSKIFIPADAKKIKFSDKLAKQMVKFLKENDPKLICVYGEFDPWTAVAPDKALFEGKKNMYMFEEPAGNHKARINTLPEDQKQQAWSILEQWIQ